MLIKYNMKNIFLRKSFRKLVRKKSSRPLFIFQKALYQVKASDQDVSLNIFW